MNEKDYIDLQRYRAGELSEAERAAFAERLKNEPELQQEANWQAETEGFLRRKAEAVELQKTFAEAGKNYFTEDKKKTNSVRKSRLRLRPWLWAAVAAAAIVLFLIFNPLAEGDLYEKYNTPLAISLLDKSNNTENAQAAEMSFNAGDYATAYDNLNIYRSTNPNDIQAKLALGIAAGQIGKQQEAEQILQEIADGESGLRNEGKWFLALFYLKNTEQNKAKVVLQGINEKSARFESAMKLLKELEIRTK